MSANPAIIDDGKKFMWDGRIYGTTQDASRAEQSYSNDHFEVRRVENGGKFLVYTRRVVKEVAVAEQ